MAWKKATNWPFCIFCLAKRPSPASEISEVLTLTSLSSYGSFVVGWRQIWSDRYSESSKKQFEVYLKKSNPGSNEKNRVSRERVFYRGCLIIIWTGLNIKTGIVQKVYDSLRWEPFVIRHIGGHSTTYVLEVSPS